MDERYKRYFFKKYNKYLKSLNDDEEGMRSFSEAMRCLHKIQTLESNGDIKLREPKITSYYIECLKAGVIKEQRYEDAGDLRELQIRGERFLKMFSKNLITEKTCENFY